MNIVDWGLIDYRVAQQRQLDLVDIVSREHARETLVFCSHPPIVTLGRGTLEGDVFGWPGETIEVGRGGRATYHGPSQIVVYPILDLNSRGRDLHAYMRALEHAVVASLAEFGLEAEGGREDATGVWIGERKIASIGIGVRQWVSYHGLALNVDSDAAAFAGMKPCGFTPGTMISMEELVDAPVDRAQVQKALEKNLLEILEVTSFRSRMPLASRPPTSPRL